MSTKLDELADYYVDVVLEGQGIDEQVTHDAFKAGYQAALSESSDLQFDEAPTEFNAKIVRKRARAYYELGDWKKQNGISKVVMHTYYRGAVDQFSMDQAVMLPIIQEHERDKVKLAEAEKEIERLKQILGEK